MSPDQNQNMTVISRTKVSNAAFAALPLTQRISELNTMPARRRSNAILSDPEGKSLVRALPEPDFFWLIKELGIADSNELIEMASPEQLVFCFDLDIWEKWTPQPERLFDWLQAIMEGTVTSILECIRQMDQELLILFLQKEIQVGGGLQLLSNEDEPTDQYEHTCDNIYYFNFLNKEHSIIVGQLLELLCQNDQRLYVSLLEGVRSELPTDLEEECYHFRSGRLADLGFPELTEALGVFSYVNPETFVPAKEKDQLPPPECPFLPISVPGDDLLLNRALAAASASTIAELRTLFNAALMAEATPFADSDAIAAVCKRVCGYLNLALEHFCGTDVDRATLLLEREYLKKLCQVGYSLVIRLRQKGEEIPLETLKVNRPAGRALDGVLKQHPRFYRGLDMDHADGYRDFRTLADLRLMAEFIANLTGG